MSWDALPLPLLAAAVSRPLIAPARLLSPLSLTRAQVDTRATALGADGATWAEFLADVPRFNGAARRSLIGGQRTNAIRNPRGEGAVVGVPGTLPTNWTSSAPAGVSREVVGFGVEGGIEYVDIRFTGTVTTAAGIVIRPDTLLAIAATAGQIWTASSFVRLLAGSLPTACVLSISERNGAGSQLATSNTTINPTDAPLSGQRYSHTRTLTNALTVAASTHPLELASISVSTVVEFTVRVGWPQMELGAFASTPILPAVGAPAASTRGADLVSATLASLGIGANGACTILGVAMLPQNAPAGSNQALFQVDDGSDNNRFMLRNIAGGATMVAARVLAGVTVDATSAGSMTAGTLFRWGATIDGTGRVAVSLNGGAVQAATGGPTSGLTTLRVGNNAANTAPMHGETGQLSILPLGVSNTQLAAFVAAMPAQ